MSSPLKMSGCHLALVTLGFEGGGPERDTVLLCNALADKGVRVTILALRDEGPLRALIGQNAQVVIIPERRMRYAIPSLRRAIRLLAPSVVISSGIPSLNLATLIAARTLPRGKRPKIVLREGAVPSMARHDPSRSNRIAYQILRHFYHYADRVVTVIDEAGRELAQDFSLPKAMISVLRVNAVISPSVMLRLEQWDGESGRENDLIVCVGRLSREKDQYTLLRAMALMPPERTWRLAIVGDGPERAKLEAFARRYGLADRTFFTGYVTDPFTWMMRARVLVNSSIYEGFGNAIVEALACGTPVVATDCPYGPRETLQNGRYGALTPVGDPEAMARAIAAALDSAPDRGRLMRRGLEYTAERTAARFLQIIADLEASPTGPTNPLVAADTS